MDEADLPLVRDNKRYLTKKGYVIIRWHASRALEFLHRAILKPSPGQQVDHINGDRLDNRRCNLRVCTHAQNLHNTKRSRRNTSGFKGVHLDRATGKFVATIYLDGKTRYLGSFRTPEEAKTVWDARAKAARGEFHRP